MKLVVFLVPLVFCTNNLFSQTMVIKKDNGSYEQINITENVVFYNHPVCARMPKVYFEGGPNNDNDGNGDYYNTVSLNGKCWFKENLNVGTFINSAQQMSSNGIIEKYCHNNDPANCKLYGGFYQWYEAMQYSATAGVQGICPEGWHIPTNAELQTWHGLVGGNGSGLKAIGETIGYAVGTNTSGFSARMVGYYTYYGNQFTGIGSAAVFWSSNEYNGTNTYTMFLNWVNDDIEYEPYNKVNAMSIRCIRD